MSQKRRDKKRKKLSKLRRRQALKQRRKRAESLKKLGIDPQSTPFLIRDYYLPTFAKWIHEMRQETSNASRPCPARWSYWQRVQNGTHEPAQGAKVVRQYLDELAKEMAETVSTTSLACWLHATRRIAPAAVGEDPRATAIIETRAVLDAAIQKWAPLALCKHIGKSDEVAPDAILRSELLAQGGNGMLENLAAAPQLVLTDFGPENLRGIFAIEKVAYEIRRSMAQLRGLGKGASLVVTGREEDPVFEHRSSELSYLIQNYDKRVELNPFNTTATGTVFGQHVKTERKGVVFIPQYNGRRMTFDDLGELFESALKVPLRVIGPGFGGPNFVWSSFDIGAFYNAHRPLREPFRIKHGVSLESVLGIIAAISWSVVASWTEKPAKLWQSWQRAYEGPLFLEDFEPRLENALSSLFAQIEMPFTTDEVSVHDAVEFLTLREEKRNDIGVDFPGPHYIFLPCGMDRFFIDYANLGSRLYYLFHGITLSNQNFKGEALEAFTRREDSPLSGGQLFSKDGTSRQVDAAFGAEDVLIIAECRVVARSIAVERGDPKALVVRRSVVENTLADIDDKAHWLASRPIGNNYDISTYRTILPIGVTPFREYIPSRDDRYWIHASLPRVLSPDELLAMMDSGNAAELARNCPNSVQVGM